MSDDEYVAGRLKEVEEEELTDDGHVAGRLKEVKEEELTDNDT